ncbi:uncharacterized protein LOC125315670 isoform X3 [Rhodamnia argentea]|uniref:Uncharacterized protein LOC125315670 isoform X3 n=1 Tax=Rhodamnia argentea TaxID=178133 RepID=A0ABM3HLB9_9MYRT|nr:uncharacterized protein LOC125315670 isoform X3 [Rhodamnia argentea]
MRLTWRSHGFFAVSRQALFVRKPRNSPSWVRATSPQKHVYHDPIPELAASVCTKSFERRKFERDPREKLSGDIDTLGEDLDSVIKVCTQEIQIFIRTFNFRFTGLPTQIAVSSRSDIQRISPRGMWRTWSIAGGSFHR